MIPLRSSLYLEPSSPQASLRMGRVRQKGTDVELALRRELSFRNLKYRICFPVLKKPRRVADIVFPSLRIAVFVDGCFWHGCPLHGTWPKSNPEFWRQKIDTNRSRDAETTAMLQAANWKVLRAWAHESPCEVAEAISVLVAKSKLEQEKPESHLIRRQ